MSSLTDNRCNYPQLLWTFDQRIFSHSTVVEELVLFFSTISSIMSINYVEKLLICGKNVVLLVNVTVENCDYFVLKKDA